MPGIILLSQNIPIADIPVQIIPEIKVRLLNNEDAFAAESVFSIEPLPKINWLRCHSTTRGGLLALARIQFNDFNTRGSDTIFRSN